MASGAKHEQPEYLIPVGRNFILIGKRVTFWRKKLTYMYSQIFYHQEIVTKRICAVRYSVLLMRSELPFCARFVRAPRANLEKKEHLVWLYIIAVSLLIP